MNSINTEEGCLEPPCWKKVPILESCNGKRCIYEGQQCTGNTHKLNFAGYICKGIPNEFYSGGREQQCTKPPCWHKIPEFLEASECQNKKCTLVGQKCKIGGTEENPLFKICLNEKTTDCPYPPCWVESAQILEKCPNMTGFCPDENAKDADGNLIFDSNNKPIKVPAICDYKGSCPIRGQKCKKDGAEYISTGSDKGWINTMECVDSYRGEDTLPNSVSNIQTCIKKPCWMDLTGGQSKETGDMYRQAKKINNSNTDGTNTTKNDILIKNYLDNLHANNSNPQVYKFIQEDREGYITESILKNFMTQNWKIFEANVIDENFKIIWNKFSRITSGTRIMTYPMFTAMMRLLKVEKFKFLTANGKSARIIPRFMSPSDAKVFADKFGIDFEEDSEIKQYQFPI